MFEQHTAQEIEAPAIVQVTGATVFADAEEWYSCLVDACDYRPPPRCRCHPSLVYSASGDFPIPGERRVTCSLPASPGAKRIARVPCELTRPALSAILRLILS